MAPKHFIPFFYFGKRRLNVYILILKLTLCIEYFSQMDQKASCLPSATQFYQNLVPGDEQVIHARVGGGARGIIPTTTETISN